MSFAHPLALLALAPLALAIALSGWRRLSRLPWLRALITLLVRLAICLLLIGALADPQVTRAASGVHVVFVVDRSAAVGAVGQRAEDAWVRKALQAQHADDSAALVHFGGTPAGSGQISATKLPHLPPADPVHA